MNENVLSIKNLNVVFDKKEILKNVFLNIEGSKRCAIVGPNGAGKTTLIKTILNLNKDYKGDFLFWGKNFLEVKEKIGYVPQKKNVDWNFPITVNEVVEMGIYNFNNSFFLKKSDNLLNNVEESLRLMDMIEYKNYHINNLSGGQQQRIFVARALAQKADLYIMDEPFTGLDKNSENKIADIFFKLQNENKTIIAVHHDFNTLEKYFDWVIFLNKTIFYNGPLEGCDLDYYFNLTF